MIPSGDFLLLPEYPHQNNKKNALGKFNVPGCFQFFISQAEGGDDIFSKRREQNGMHAQYRKDDQGDGAIGDHEHPVEKRFSDPDPHF